jgi:flagellar protein FliS
MYDIRDRYLETKVLSADPMQLVGMLYEAALKSIAEARRHLNSGNIQARSRSITHTMDILSELLVSLDLERGGELARRLQQIYTYVLERLAEANRDQVEAPLVESARLLGTLAEAWTAVAPATSRRAAAAESEADYVPQSWNG